MPAITIATLRANGHKRLVYLSLMTGSVVLNASVSATPTFPASNIAITVNSGSEANVKRGMRVVVETAAGLYKGTLHIRAAGTISSANLPVREVSKGFVAVASTDVLKVYDDFPIVDKLVAASETFAPDQETYSAQNSDPAPIVSSGGAWAGWKADAAAIAFDGTNALNLDPDTADTITWANSTSGGSLSSGTAASPTLNLSATATGRYLVTRAATAVNTKTRTQYVAVRTHDTSDMPYLGVEESSMQADPLNGWTYSIRLFTDISSWPDMAPVIVWVDETINGTRQSLGAKASGRSHIKCMGYVRRTGSGWDEGEKRQYVTVEIMSPLAALGLLPGFSKVMTADATPDKWSEIKTLTVKRAIALLALSYTTLNESGHDLVFDDASMTTKLYPQLFLQKIDPLSQLRELALAVDCRVTCDRTGRVEVQHRLELLIDSSRAAVTETLALTTADLIAYDLDREEVETVETFRTRGFVASATVAGATPLFAHWPGDAPGMGNQSDMQERLIADSASDNYQRCARYGAWANKVYVTAAGVKKRAPKLKVVLPGTYDCVDLYREFIGVTFTGNLRGVSPSDFKWLVESISTEWDRGTGRVTLDLVAATHGIIDETEADDTPPTDENSPFPPYTPVPVDPYPLYPPVLPPAGLGKGTGNVATLWSDNVLRITRDWSTPAGSGGPTYANTALSGVANWGGGDLVDFAVHAFSPLYIQTGSTVEGWLTSTTKAQKISDIFGTVALSAAHTLPGTATTTQRAMHSERGEANFCIVITYIYAGSVRASYTTNGTTWNDAIVSSFHDTDAGGHWAAGIYILPGVAGKAFTEAFTNNATLGSKTSSGYVTTNYGASWTALSDPNITPGHGLGGAIQASFSDAAGKPVYFRKTIWDGSTFLVRLYRADGSGAPVDISPEFGGVTFGPINQRCVVVSDSDPNTVLLIGADETPTNFFTVAITHNAKAAVPTWTQIVASTPTPTYTRGYLSDPSNVYLLGPGALAFSSDWGVTLESKIGNIVTSATCIGLCGG